MKERKNGLVAAAASDKATLPKGGVVVPEFEVTKETVIELAAPIRGDSGNDCAVEREETEDNSPKEGEGRGAVDDPNPNRGDDKPPPMLGFVTVEVAGAAAEMEEDVLERKSDPWLGKEEWVVDRELLKENDEVGPEEKLKLGVVEEDEELTVTVAGVEIELNENGNGFGADGAANKLLATDELGFDEGLSRDDDELKENAVEKEEEPNELDCVAEVAVEPKEKDGVGLAGATVAEEDEKMGEAAEEKENGEDDDAKELEEIEKENTVDGEDDAEDVAEGLEGKDDAIQIRDGLLPLYTLNISSKQRCGRPGRVREAIRPDGLYLNWIAQEYDRNLSRVML